jgi:hypothetical protein
VVLAELPLIEASAQTDSRGDALSGRNRQDLERFCFPAFDSSRTNHVESLACTIPDLPKLLRAWDQTFEVSVLSHPSAALADGEPVDLFLWTQPLVNTGDIVREHHPFSQWRLRTRVIGRRHEAVVLALTPHRDAADNAAGHDDASPRTIVTLLRPGEVVGLRGLFPLVLQQPADADAYPSEGKLVDVVVFLSLAVQ